MIEKYKNLFHDNKYSKWYFTIVKKIQIDRNTKKIAQKKMGYIESHHVIPMCIDPKIYKEKWNIVHCTMKEHFLLHKLLIKMTENSCLEIKMLRALAMFSMRNSKQKRFLDVRNKLLIKEAHSKSAIGKNNYRFGKVGTFKDKKHTEKSKKRMSEIRKGKSWEDLYGKEKCEVIKQKFSQARKGKKYFEPYSQERRYKIGLSNQKYMWITNGKDNFRFLKTDAIPVGYYQGRTIVRNPIDPNTGRFIKKTFSNFTQ